MINLSSKVYYLFLSIIFQTISTLSIKCYLNLFKNEKSHPYILTVIYFTTYLLFIIIYYSNVPKSNKKKKKNLPGAVNNFRNRIKLIKLYKTTNIITVENNINNKAEKCNKCRNNYFFKNEILYPSLLLILGHGINIYTLNKLNVILHLMMNGSILICQFRLMKSKEITKIKPNKLIAAIIDVFSIICFIIYLLFMQEVPISYLFCILLALLSSIIIAGAKYYNYNTIHRYSINFIRNNIKIGEKSDNLLEKQSINNSEDIEIINNENEEKENETDNETEKDNIKENKINNYFSYEKIIFYEGILCFSFWAVIVLVSSFIKCPEDKNSFIRLFICNNCTSISGYETFFDSKEMIIFNNIEYKNEIVKYIYNYPLCSLIFIVIILVTEFFSHFSFQKIFQGKYKTKLIILKDPIIAIIIFGIGYFGNNFSNSDSFLNQILPNITYSELIVCLSLFLGTIVTYLRLFEINCRL